MVRVTNASNTEIQLSDLVVIKEGDTNLLLNKGEISNIGSGLTHTSETNYGEFSIKTDEFNTTNLIFDPVDPYTQDYDIKVLQKEYIGSTVGIATTNLGTLIDITNSTQLASSGVTTNIIGVSTTKFNSLVVNSKVKDIVSNEVNFVESFVTHDGESAYIAESYYDSTGKVFSGENIGSFGANINNNVMNLEFLNDSSSNDIQINSRIVGFGTTAGFSSAGEYLFKSTGQSNPRAVQYYSNYADNKISTGFGLTVTVYGTSTIIDAAKSIVQVSVGSTRALYQVMVVKDGSDNHHIQQSQLLFTDDKNVTGIGTFGITGQMSLNYYPDSSYSSNYNEVVSYTEFLYTENDKVNIPNDLVYGNSVDSTYIKDYAGINGEIGNKNNLH